MSTTSNKRHSIGLREEEVKGLDALTARYGVSRPQVLRIALARFAESPPTPAEIAASARDPKSTARENPTLAKSRSAIFARRDDCDILNSLIGAHGLTRPQAVRIGLARLGSEPPTEAERTDASKPQASYRSGGIHLRDDHRESLDAIAEAHEMTRPAVVAVCVARLAADPPTAAEIAESHLDRRPRPRDADPSPEEIDARCQEIQEEWTPQDRQARIHERSPRGEGRQRKRKRPGWTVPQVKIHSAGMH